MPHYKSMFDASEFLFAFDLDGKDVVVQVASVSAGTITGKDGRKAKKPMVVFRGSSKKLALNKTNAAIVAKLYGTDPTKWVGKWLTLYPTTTSFGGEIVDCIRVRPLAPPPPKKTTDDPAPVADAEEP